MSGIAPYTMALCRPATGSVFGADGMPLDGALDANIAIACDAIARAAGEHGARLVVFAQFAMTGYTPLGPEAWLGAAVTFPGPEMERLGEAARKAGVYAAVQIAEKHAAFPGRYFFSVAVLTPEGEIGLAYRKNYSLSLRTSPVDVYDRFVETFGHAAFLPVLDTPIGGLGVSIGAEPHWPEPIRAMALKGAEVILNPVAAMQGIDYLNRPGAELCRPVRAFENAVYFGMANIAQGELPSQAWDYEGRPIGAAVSEEFHLSTIDIEALRRARSQPAGNLLAGMLPQIEEDRSALTLWPSNAFGDAPPAGFAAMIAVETQVRERLQALGRDHAPAPEPTS
ncbi:MAG: nitrilase-related carbon-nitrogen hydrolase [Pseudomonadota bacterium]|uniref:nitrilase-related carbon-nitrogen hydrolase n=1 Tax=Novosphingobium sp. MBES04 TaxID=1206458 RepID=UPI00057F79D0|nr:nitrilase-related carbon-nitrogen hydrolase [Novosphingobium sp. MBES04]MED5546784.1 nitrilase-related carbon-nitrogen hydrolase [Pseudomonadota bacterium]GAM05254.1 Nitrilase/cyanide hydratase and apolipoprotein N-acyltransferase [Novosphingobium sp. MBES04]